MPPARKRARSYDPAKTRAAVRAQFDHVRAAVLGLTPEQLAAPTRLGDWTVRELAAHLALGYGSVPRALAEPEPATRELELVEWPFATAPQAGGVDEAARTAAAGADLPGLYAEVAADLDAVLPDAPDDRVVAMRAGTMRLGDAMVTRAVELIVHTDDLNAATGLAVPYDRAALGACVRLLADALAVKAPGGSVEVRVPPYAVVQCVPGPRHTRGTPPNVVETDPLTWLRLATGRARWADEVAAARVRAGGERADLAALLPVMS
ncbi:maleylpyruvate isomerase family mycothiol-dependent enzyme [Streptomyces sp. LP05-1]|uniref:Maleylpyruvate isomerase family mycothiol-dependent enzyme n=1 Tax=Streptomyces pyxinae TaxID=2970734 RepID=A0ABT2CQN7_9ACTN|nr:maleylpyruvate isomerase family mycothiol-dependent enzyme [Streptomyces sp. LP05-1]MCS0638854.1 maleylpyruvate isomerase family mycothiol-dependent enzyme [Streptomyces sp. LP05-1]